MRIKFFALSLLFLCFSIWLTGCSDEAGEGGLASISGKIFAEEYNSSGFLITSYYVPEERVYIVYGDHPVFDDDTRTHFDGTFRFNYLNKGKYTIYAYSECPSCPSGTEAVSIEVEISSRKEQLVLEDIVIRK